MQGLNLRGKRVAASPQLHFGIGVLQIFLVRGVVIAIGPFFRIGERGNAQRRGGNDGRIISRNNQVIQRRQRCGRPIRRGLRNRQRFTRGRFLPFRHDQRYKCIALRKPASM